WTSGTPCSAGASGSFSSPVALTSAQAEMALNTAPITNYLSTNHGIPTSFPTGTFGETAINLTDLITAVGGTSCEFFGHLQRATARTWPAGATCSPASAAATTRTRWSRPTRTT